jgi:hypothetical protein
MTLGQFAVAVGATPRWVLNALTRLRRPRRYDEPLARRLSLARMLAETLDVPLSRAYDVAGRALAEAKPEEQWRMESDNGAVILVIDLPRFFTAYLPRLALAQSRYGERVRGRSERRSRSAVARATAYGFDPTLIPGELTRTPAGRVSELDANRDFYERIRIRER